MQLAGDVVNFINGTHNRGVRYWIIANEPDVDDTCHISPKWGFGYNRRDSLHADSIARYVRDMALQMKLADPNIIIIGPELARFGTTPNTNGNDIMKQLCAPNHSAYILGRIPNGNGNASGKRYVNILSIHTYPDSITRLGIVRQPTGKNGFKNRLEANNSNEKGTAAHITTADTVGLRFAPN